MPVVIEGRKHFGVTTFTIRWFCVQMLTSVENVHYTHLQFAAWGTGGCCWKLFKFNTHTHTHTHTHTQRSKCERGERNPDELVITFHENTHMHYDHTHTHTHTPLSAAMSSFQQALIFSLCLPLSLPRAPSVLPPCLPPFRKAKCEKHSRLQTLI